MKMTYLMQSQRYGSLPTLMQYADTGESGETYDIDVQTVPWSTPGPRFPTSLWGLDDSESGEAYEAEVEEIAQRPTGGESNGSAPNPA